MTTALRYVGYMPLIPRTLLGMLVFAVVYKAHSWRWNEGCIECIGGQTFALDENTNRHKWVTRIWGTPAAQTWGFAIVHSSFEQMMRLDLRVHERRHVWQAVYTLEVGFLLVYGGHFLWGRYLSDGKAWVIGQAGYVSVPRTYPRPEDTGTPLHEAVPERWKRAYLKVIWERLANRYQRDFLNGHHAEAWGSNP